MSFLTRIKERVTDVIAVIIGKPTKREKEQETRLKKLERQQEKYAAREKLTTYWKRQRKLEKMKEDREELPEGVIEGAGY